MYRELIRKKNSTIYAINKYAPYGYDSVVMLARALNATEERLKKTNQSLREFEYDRQDITELIKEEISKTNDVKGLTVSHSKLLEDDEEIDVNMQSLIFTKLGEKLLLSSLLRKMYHSTPPIFITFCYHDYIYY
jgi:hypothetical protein